jgi:hypothetical protein
MYCQSCGVPSAPGLSYCKQCGANLNLTKDGVGSKSAQSVMDSTFWVTLFGLAAIVGGVAAMKALEFREVFIIAYMILSTTAFLGIYGMHVWQFIQLTRGSNKSDRLSERVDTKELNPAQPRGLGEFAPSVTEHTTKTLEPAPIKRKVD